MPKGPLFLALSCFLMTAKYSLAKPCPALFNLQAEQFLIEYESTLSNFNKNLILDVFSKTDTKDRLKVLKSHYWTIVEEQNDLLDDFGDEVDRSQVILMAVEGLNELAALTYEVLKADGVKVTLKTQLDEIDGFKKLVVNILPEQEAKSSSGFARSLRAKELFEVEFYEMDLFRSIEYSYSGSFHAQSNRLNLDLESIRDLALSESSLTGLVAHEFKHAGFHQGRLKGIDSLYHARFMAKQGETLWQKSRFHPRFMAAEELYTYANLLFWELPSPGELKNFDRLKFIEKLEGARKLTRFSDEVFAQLSYMSRNSRKLLEVSSKSYEELNLNFKGLAEKAASSSEEVRWVEVDLGNSTYSDWIDQSKFTQELDDIFNLKAEDSLAAKERIINHLKTRLTGLESIAEHLRLANEEVKVKLAQLHSSFLSIETKPALNDPDFLESYKQFRREIRRMGTSARENFDGFILKLMQARKGP